MMKNTFKYSKPIIGVIYLEPLLGYAKCPGLSKVLDIAMKDCRELIEGGADGILLENEKDIPHTLKARPEAIASMTYIASEIRKEFISVPLGVEFLLNDPKASMAIATATNCEFIRTDYFVDPMKRDEYGIMEIKPQDWMQYNQELNDGRVQVFSDIQVKYATMLEERSLGESAKLAMQAGAAGAVVSGKITGVAPKVEDVYEAKELEKNFPILIGSGLDITNAAELLEVADGAIVGSSLMKETRIQKELVQKLMDEVIKLR